MSEGERLTGYHAAKRSWVAKHGPDYLLLDRVDQMLGRR